MKIGVLAIALASTLCACSHEPVKEEPKPEAPAPVVQQPAAAPAPVVQQPVAGSPLDDPRSILYKRSVYFDFNKYDVKSDYQPLVQAHAQYVVAHLGARVVIQGNCDEVGSSEYNLALGQRRADAVMKSMKLLGVKDAQIESVSFGKEKPKATGNDEAAHAENRRDDIVYNTKQ